MFGLDDDGPGVFRNTVDWALEHGLTTATFQRMEAAGRIQTCDGDPSRGVPEGRHESN